VTVGSLFSGIGGFDLGLERAGMTVKWQVERDPWCQKILAKHWPDVPRYENVEDVGGELECVDLICGGFPCQPVSVAGQQKGADDDRWLWPEFKRIVGLLGPRYVLVENVPGLFAANGGHAFGEVIGDLADLGYDAEWTVLSAADVGAPHLRKRVWIVAHANSRGCEVEREPEPPRIESAHRGIFNGRRHVWDIDDATQDSNAHWSVEPDVGRVAYGVPLRVDRLKGLGNAIVPQCAEWIGRQLLT
jgi:DNA (cytosine-5)-methyltransferase 1